MSRYQIRGRGSFDRPCHLPGDAQPSLQVQFHYPARFENIRGHWWFSHQLEAPAIVWGKNGRYWAFLHDFDARGIRLILDACRQATFERRGAYANPFAWRW